MDAQTLGEFITALGALAAFLTALATLMKQIQNDEHVATITVNTNARLEELNQHVMQLNNQMLDTVIHSTPPAPLNAPLQGKDQKP